MEESLAYSGRSSRNSVTSERYFKGFMDRYSEIYSTSWNLEIVEDPSIISPAASWVSSFACPLY